MHVYFVRHGETLLNKTRVHQSPSTPLSPKGKEEAVATAKYLKDVQPDFLISSEYTRALETSRIIGLHTGLPTKTNSLMSEIIRPTVLFGQSHLSLQTLRYIFLSLIHRNKSSWHYTDAENVIEISNRSKRALEYLESLEGTHRSVVVVSHTIFLSCMVSYMCKSHVPLRIYDIFLAFLTMGRIKNGSVIHAEYTGETIPGTCSWKLIHDGNSGTH